MKNKYEIRGNTAVIILEKKNKQYKTIIDLDDLDRAMELPGYWTYYHSKHTKSKYVVGWAKPYKDREKGMCVALARFLYDDIPDGMVVDHINHDTLDNRRSINLRVVTETVNRNNRKTKQRKGSRKIKQAN